MAKIINLLQNAIIAKDTFKQEHERRTSQGKSTASIFICHIIRYEYDKLNTWQDVVGPHMECQFNYGDNNIASHIHSVTGTKEINLEQSKIVNRVADYVRFKWLDDLITSALHNGDDAILPNIASNDEIKVLYKQLTVINNLQQEYNNK